MKTIPKILQRRPPMGRILSGLALAIACGLPAIRAQTTDKAPAPVEIPAGPLLKVAPDFSKWTVTYLYPKDKGPGAQPLSGDETHQAITTRTKDIVRDEIVDGRGCRSDTWHVGATQYHKPAGKSVWAQASQPTNIGVSDSGYIPLPANGFRDLDWIGSDSFGGSVTFESIPCLAFYPGAAARRDLPGAPRTAEQFAALPLVAYVNAETRLPVALRVGGITRRFEFAPPPSSMQSLPPDLLDQIKKGEEARARLLQAAPRPF